jgi:Fe2+ transport system protein FeoA
MLLNEVSLGKTARVLAVNATETDVLKYLQERGILPGQELTVIEVAPLDGPLMLRLADGKDVAIGLSLAEFVIVK